MRARVERSRGPVPSQFRPGESRRGHAVARRGWPPSRRRVDPLQVVQVVPRLGAPEQALDAATVGVDAHYGDRPRPLYWPRPRRRYRADHLRWPRPTSADAAPDRQADRKHRPARDDRGHPGVVAGPAILAFVTRGIGEQDRCVGRCTHSREERRQRAQRDTPGNRVSRRSPWTPRDVLGSNSSVVVRTAGSHQTGMPEVERKKRCAVAPCP